MKEQPENNGKVDRIITVLEVAALFVLAGLVWFGIVEPVGIKELVALVIAVVALQVVLMNRQK